MLKARSMSDQAVTQTTLLSGEQSLNLAAMWCSVTVESGLRLKVRVTVMVMVMVMVMVRVMDVFPQAEPQCA